MNGRTYCLLLLLLSFVEASPWCNETLPAVYVYKPIKEHNPLIEPIRFDVVYTIDDSSFAAEWRYQMIMKQQFAFDNLMAQSDALIK